MIDLTTYRPTLSQDIVDRRRRVRSVSGHDHIKLHTLLSTRQFGPATIVLFFSDALVNPSSGVASIRKGGSLDLWDGTFRTNST